MFSVRAIKYEKTLLKLTDNINMKGFDEQRAAKLTQDIYDDDIASLLSNGFTVICPDTNEEVVVTEKYFFGTYTRDVYIFNDNKIVNLPLELQRIILPCGTTHTLIPRCLIPYSPITYFGALEIYKFYNSHGESSLNSDIEDKYGERINTLINNSAEHYDAICNLNSTQLPDTLFGLICVNIINFIKTFFNNTKQVFLVNRKMADTNTGNKSFKRLKIIYVL